MYCSSILSTLLINIVIFFVPANGDTAKYQVYSISDNDTRKILFKELKEDYQNAWLVQAYYTNGSHSHGWDQLELKTNPALRDEVQMYEAGFLEGYLTHEQITNHWHNVLMDTWNNQSLAGVIKKVNKYLSVNHDYAMRNAAENTQDPFWYQVFLYYKQFDGLYDGYKKGNPQSNITKEQMMWLNMAMDVMELMTALANKTEREFIKNPGHCSALIKLLPGYEDIYFGHVSWITYNWMTRIIKRYDFSVRESIDSSYVVPGSKIAFSSYPGITNSMDDFYLIGSGLVAIETTNNVYDQSIYKYIDASSQIPESVRCMVANRLATGGSSWAKYYSKANSGTYNNQFMILDLNQFTPGMAPKKNALWIVEQMPGKMMSNDETQHLIANSAFASYNIPFYPEIYNYSGTQKMFEKAGDWYSHEQCSRAKIFRREHNTVRDLDSMMRMMRFNHYKTDPYSVCEECIPKEMPLESISSRGDLYPVGGKVVKPYGGHVLFGAIDVKVSSAKMFSNGEIVAISGPSPSDNLPPFSWTTANNDRAFRHQGQPETWNFGRLTTRWGGVFTYTSSASSSGIVSLITIFISALIASAHYRF